MEPREAAKQKEPPAAKKIQNAQKDQSTQKIQNTQKKNDKAVPSHFSRISVAGPTKESNPRVEAAP